MKSIFEQLEVHAKRHLEKHTDDFFVHDANAIAKLSIGTEFLWFVWPRGTFIAYLTHPEMKSKAIASSRKPVSTMFCEYPDARAWHCKVTEVNRKVKPGQNHLSPAGTIEEVGEEAAIALTSESRRMCNV